MKIKNLLSILIFLLIVTGIASCEALEKNLPLIPKKFKPLPTWNLTPVEANY